MALRTTMAALIQELRDLVGDPAVPNYTRSDEELQAVLDRHRSRYLDWPLTAEPVVGSVLNEWSANGIGFWEADAAIKDASGSAVVPVTADWRLGYWTFASGQSALYVTGYVYDLHGAAAEVLGKELAMARGITDWSSEGQSVSASQKVGHLKDLLDYHENRAGSSSGGGAGGVTVVKLKRTDGGRRGDWARGI